MMRLKIICRASIAGLLTVLLLTSTAFAGKRVQVKVTGMDNASVDRAAIQAALDSAPGSPLTVKLRGVFQLDGQDLLINRSDLSIKADRNGAWLKGKLGPDGRPIDDITNFPNRGFVVSGAGLLENIEIKGLYLTGLRSPVYLRGITGSIRDVQVKGNDISMSIQGVVAIGDVADVSIADNVIADVSDTGITLRGDSAIISDIKVVDNHVSNATSAALLLVGAAGIEIRNNYLATGDTGPIPAPFVADGTNTGIVVDGNTMVGGIATTVLVGTANDFTLSRNCFRSGGSQGLSGYASGGVNAGIFGIPSSGYDIADNSYQDNVAGPAQEPRDVWLTTTSAANVVIEYADTVVLDEGTGNAVDVFAGTPVDYCAD